MPNNELISRDALPVQVVSIRKRVFKNGRVRNENSLEKVVFLSDLKAAPAVDAAPVVHGRWIWVRDEEDSSVEHLKCSVCMGNGADENDGYCRHCGAKMDLEE